MKLRPEKKNTIRELINILNFPFNKKYLTHDAVRRVPGLLWIADCPWQLFNFFFYISPCCLSASLVVSDRSLSLFASRRVCRYDKRPSWRVVKVAKFFFCFHFCKVTSKITVFVARPICSRSHWTKKNGEVKRSEIMWWPPISYTKRIPDKEFSI